ncbi:MAG: tRNA/rRNA methyltransferase, partial [Enterobacteriaceae bacterium]
RSVTPSEPTEEAVQTPERIDPALIRRQRAQESRVYGENACQALFAARPEAIVRAWFVQSVTPRFREALRWLAANRKAYHVVDEQELNKVSNTEHHGGVCFLIKKRPSYTVEEYLQQAPTQQDCVIALNKEGNPHNLGAIMRNCAHFAARGILLADPALLESGAAVRTAAGGAESIVPVISQDLAAELALFQQAGYTLVTTSGHKGEPLSQATLPERMVLLLGVEAEELNDSRLQKGSQAVTIDGSGKVDSLNMAVASGILLAEWWRQQKGRNSGK